LSTECGIERKVVELKVRAGCERKGGGGEKAGVVIKVKEESAGGERCRKARMGIEVGKFADSPPPPSSSRIGATVVMLHVINL